jgi:hypothetical protein
MEFKLRSQVFGTRYQILMGGFNRKGRAKDLRSICQSEQKNPNL